MATITIKARNEITGKVKEITGEELENKIISAGQAERWLPTHIDGEFAVQTIWVEIRKIKVQLESDVVIIKHKEVTSQRTGKVIENKYSFNYLSDLQELEKIRKSITSDQDEYNKMKEFYTKRGVNYDEI